SAIIGLYIPLSIPFSSSRVILDGLRFSDAAMAEGLSRSTQQSENVHPFYKVHPLITHLPS
ncbi:MAG: hypothetical protein LBT00_11315, partial [Spirochaetaceae bacterium]|nr:hypothetical protein [Spirochaetaceae bacterium]